MKLAVLQKPTEARAAPNNCVFLPVPQEWLVSVVVYSINMSKDLRRVISFSCFYPFLGYMRRFYIRHMGAATLGC